MESQLAGILHIQKTEIMYTIFRMRQITGKE